MWNFKREAKKTSNKSSIRHFGNGLVIERVAQHLDIVNIIGPVAAPHPSMKIVIFSGAFGHRNLEEELFGQGGWGKELSKGNGGVVGGFDIPRLLLQRRFQDLRYRIDCTKQLLGCERGPILLQALHGRG